MVVWSFGTLCSCPILLLRRRARFPAATASDPHLSLAVYERL